MGYSTSFLGHFQVDKPLDDDTFNLLVGLATTRRMKRKLGSEFGVEGEFFVSGKGLFGQDGDDSILDYNKPPRTQPSLWCCWEPMSRTEIAWNGGEKFYEYIPWIKYLLEKVLLPRGYKLTGRVEWQGEDPSDVGIIVAEGDWIEGFDCQKVLLPRKAKY